MLIFTNLSCIIKSEILQQFINLIVNLINLINLITINLIIKSYSIPVIYCVCDYFDIKVVL